MNERIVELIDILNNATKEYDKGTPIMTDVEWDNLYFELQNLEKKSRIYYNNSPTLCINFETVSDLPKVKHSHKMLSLDKTKDLKDIENFLNKKEFLLMSKMDGLTCSLRYENGYLVSAETRGDGEEGELITHNAKTILNIPNRINCLGTLVIDGEIICDNFTFEEFKEDYKNSRNFAAGSIRLLDSSECFTRKLSFVAWDLIEGRVSNSLLKNLNYLSTLGFTVVPLISSAVLDESLIHLIRNMSAAKGYPIDGVVFKFDDLAYGESLGETSHHFKNAMAFKFYDEEQKTKLVDIEWTMGRTGVLTPVGIFEPVEIEGSTVTKASLHNISIMYDTLIKPYKNMEIEVFKSNMIIPQIKKLEELPKDIEEEFFEIPIKCPVCGHALTIKKDNDSEFLFCENKTCEGKFINVLDHFVGKKGLDVKGLSKATLEKLLDWGWISSISDIFNLEQHKAEWIKKSGFGAKSVSNILNAIEESKKCSLESFICAMGIPLIGERASKILANEFKTWEEFRKAIDDKYKFFNIDTFGDSIHQAILNFDYSEFDEIYKLLKIEKVQEEETKIEKRKDDLTVVITGKLNNYKSRSLLEKDIVAIGGKVVSSISSKVNYLINNDIESTSKKNLEAKKLGIEIISEENFIKNFLTK